MTLGRKIKEARGRFGLSQEQLAEKINVSRSAVAKWESDNGIPDVENIKLLACIFNLSIDYLLDEEGIADEYVIREPYNLSDYSKGSKKKKKDMVVCSKFPNARIYTLIGKVKLSKNEKIVDNVLGFFTNSPFGIPEFINGMKNLDKEFYLVETDDKQYFVTVYDEFIETRSLDKRITENKFELGEWNFIKCAYEIKLKEK